MSSAISSASRSIIGTPKSLSRSKNETRSIPTNAAAMPDESRRISNSFTAIAILTSCSNRARVVCNTSGKFSGYSIASLDDMRLQQRDWYLLATEEQCQHHARRAAAHDAARGLMSVDDGVRFGIHRVHEILMP